MEEGACLSEELRAGKEAGAMATAYRSTDLIEYLHSMTYEALPEPFGPGRGNVFSTGSAAACSVRSSHGRGSSPRR